MTNRQTPVDDASKARVAADFSKIPAPPEGAEGEAPAAPARQPDEVAHISFIESLQAVVHLDHPFMWDGMAVHSVTARPLNFTEMMRVSEEAPRDESGSIALMHFYAAMIGLPASVIRAMEGGDAQRVVDACYPFLPRSIRESISSSTDGTSGE